MSAIMDLNGDSLYVFLSDLHKILNKSTLLSFPLIFAIYFISYFDNFFTNLFDIFYLYLIKFFLYKIKILFRLINLISFFNKNNNMIPFL